MDGRWWLKSSLTFLYQVLTKNWIINKQIQEQNFWFQWVFVFYTESGSNVHVQKNLWNKQTRELSGDLFKCNMSGLKGQRSLNHMCYFTPQHFQVLFIRTQTRSFCSAEMWIQNIQKRLFIYLKAYFVFSLLSEWNVGGAPPAELTPGVQRTTSS